MLRLTYDRASERVEAHTLSLFAQPIDRVFQASEVKYADTIRPLTTFEVRERALQYLNY